MSGLSVNAQRACAGLRARWNDIAINLLLVAVGTFGIVRAVQFERWTALGVLIAILGAYVGVLVWRRSRRVGIDQDGQPVSGRDADRLAVLKLRAYEKEQRRIAGRRRGR